MGPLKIYPASNADNRRLESTRAAGESVTVEGITVTVKSSDKDGDLVEVTRN
jgi:riboflavin synthase alpha subunit